MHCTHLRRNQDEETHVVQRLTRLATAEFWDTTARAAMWFVTSKYGKMTLSLVFNVQIDSNRTSYDRCALEDLGTRGEGHVSYNDY